MASSAYRAPLIKQGWLRALVFCVAYFIIIVSAALLAGVIAAFGAIKKTENGPQLQAVNESLVNTLMLFAMAVLSILLTWAFRKVIDRRSFDSLGFQWKGFER